MAQDLIGRVQRLLLSPKAEWDTIDQETVEPQGLITGYVAPLAAIPAVASIIGLSIIGVNVLGSTYKTPLGSAIAGGVVSFVFAIAGVFVFAFIINALAPNFGAQKNFNQAIKVSAYAPTAAWVSGIFSIFPLLGILGLVGAIYSLYLIFVGLPKMMKPPAEKATTYTIVSIVVAILASLVLGAIASQVTPGPNLGNIRSSDASSSDLDRRADAMEKAAESGDIGAIMNAAAGMMGGDPNAPIVDGDALRKLAPNKIAGLNRTSLDVESLTAPVKAVTMSAAYGDGDKTIEVTVTNSPMINAMMGIAGVAGGEYNRSSDDGYERMKRNGDSVVIEEWSKSSKRGRYGRSVAGSFLVEAKGRNVDMKELERAVGQFSERDLKGLPEAS